MALIVCPICRGDLQCGACPWRCAKGHSFDVAREGYVNLLPAQQKNSRDPGDSEDMIRARREFLDKGGYAPLREAVVETLMPLKPRSLLDMGCGEGWYTDALRAASGDVTGVDISKPAIRLAARRYPGVTWLVASGAALPDPAGIFNASLEGGTRRAIDFHEGDEIDGDTLQALVRAAAAFNASKAKAGKEKR